MTTDRYTPDEITLAISKAIETRDFNAAVSLTHMLAMRDPDRAKTILTAIQMARTLAAADG